MSKQNGKEDFLLVAGKLISKQKFGEAINYLQQIIENYNKNEKASKLLEQIIKIVEYHNRDIFGSTNLDMDPWLE